MLRGPRPACNRRPARPGSGRACAHTWGGGTLAALLGIALATLGAGCDDGLDGALPGEELSGGDTTVFDVTRDAFSLTARNLTGDRRDPFFVGNSIFNRGWVAAPSSTEGVDGLGPTYNVASCSGCHFKDGRGAPPASPDEAFVGLLVRLSVPGVAADGGPVPEPTYGGQFNHRAILGVPPEGTSSVTYVEEPGSYADGESYSLRRPHYDFSNLAFGPFADGTMFSPRTAPFMIGLGLLAAIPEDELLAAADPDDRDGDGISGRPNRVWDVAAGEARLGRFGWKANQPSLAQQNAGAFVGDIGITSNLFPDENCPPAQTACASAPNGGTPEIDDDKLANVLYYARTLAVPARRDVDDPQVLRGRGVFRALGCASCHLTELHTAAVVDDLPELANQTIHPYTDLLLHDMGPDLADGRPDFLATGVEWRTPPLWGIGLIETVNGHTNLLHDGRARGFAEAILWHGGEATSAREAFRGASAEDRAALLRFLEAL